MKNKSNHEWDDHLTVILFSDITGVYDKCLLNVVYILGLI